MKKWITGNGFQGYTFAEVEEILKNIWREASGNQDLDFSSNTLAGNEVAIRTQREIDLQNQTQDVFNLVLSPNTATGRNLDYLGEYFGLFRIAGSYTLQEVDIIADADVVLQGLDDVNNAGAFKVSDGNGNNFLLLNTSSLIAGNNTLLFRAENQGAVDVLPNTLTILITIQNGIVSCNNPQPALSIGSLEETDAQYRVRIENSKSISSIGFNTSLTGGLLATNGVSNAVVLENVSNVIDANNIPPHSIWVIVEGGTDNDIATTIRKYITFCGMKGSIVVNLPQVDGKTFIATFDRAVTISLYIQFTLKNLSTTPIDIDNYKTKLSNNISYSLQETADSGSLTKIAVDTLTSLALEGLLLGLKISNNNVDFVDILTPANPFEKWGVSNATINIILI
jgi:uncharacterized phage protein gp47/JayE